MEIQKIERKETKESPLTRFLAFSSVSVIVTGPFSCVCFAEGAAKKGRKKKAVSVQNEAKRLYYRGEPGEGAAGC